MRKQAYIDLDKARANRERLAQNEYPHTEEYWRLGHEEESDWMPRLSFQEELGEVYHRYVEGIGIKSSDVFR
jgi:hypothetical protein